MLSSLQHSVFLSLALMPPNIADTLSGFPANCTSLPWPSLLPHWGCHCSCSLLLWRGLPSYFLITFLWALQLLLYTFIPLCWRHWLTQSYLPSLLSIPARLSSPLYPSPQAGPLIPKATSELISCLRDQKLPHPLIWWQPPTCSRPQGFHPLMLERPKPPPSRLSASSRPLQFLALDGSHSPHFPLLYLGYRRQSNAQKVSGHSLLPLLSKLSKHLKWSCPSHLDPPSPHPPPHTWLTSPGLSACLYITPDTLPSWSSLPTPQSHPTEG